MKKKILFLVLCLLMLALTGCKSRDDVRTDYINAFISCMNGEIPEDCPAGILEKIQPLLDADEEEIQIYNAKYVTEEVAKDPFFFVDEVTYTTPEYSDKLIERDGYVFIKLKDLLFDKNKKAEIVVDGYVTTIQLQSHHIPYSYVKNNYAFKYAITGEKELAKNKWVIELTSKIGDILIIDMDLNDMNNIKFEPRGWKTFLN